MILIGSRAIDFWLPNFRPLGDWDICISNSELDEFVSDNNITKIRKVNGKSICEIDNNIIECESIDTSSSQLLLDINKNNPTMDVFGLQCMVIDINSLYAIKKSHIYHTDNWHKTIKDYHFLKKYHTIEYDELVKVRRLEKEKRSGSRSLMISNDEFQVLIRSTEELNEIIYQLKIDDRKKKLKKLNSI